MYIIDDDAKYKRNTNNSNGDDDGDYDEGLL